MAAPITHIVLSDKVFNSLFSTKEKKDFFIGTSFPDIRYLRVIDRSKTHFQADRFDEIKKADSFMSGVIFHSIVDNIRESLLLEKDLYSLLPKSQYLTQSLKIFEDQVIYSNVKDWSSYINYFDQILVNEIGFGISKENIKRWHDLLQSYFRELPTASSISKFIISLGFNELAAQEILSNIEIIKNLKEPREYAEELYSTIESRIALLQICN